MQTDSKRLAASYLPIVALVGLLVAVVIAAPSEPSDDEDPFGVAAGAPLDSARSAAGSSRTDAASEQGIEASPNGEAAARGGTAEAGSAPDATSSSEASATQQSAAAGDAGDEGQELPDGARPAQCLRVEVLGPAGAPCPPVWNGTDNGGATYHGVTREQINVVVYWPGRNEQINAILESTGTVVTQEQSQDIVDSLAVFFNDTYQTYGRHVKVTTKWGPGSSDDTAEQQADATTVAVDLKAFAAGSPAASEAWHEELARRRVPNVTVLGQYPESTYHEFAPYLWGVFMGQDLLADHTAEYWCKRLQGGDVTWDGDPLLTGPRKLGIIYPAGSELGPNLAARIEQQCGKKDVVAVVEYQPDITTASREATNVIVQLKEAGATTVTCLCDPLSPIFFTSQATNQAYFPEWLHNGFGATDSVGASRLYDQQQWGNSFGVSQFAPPQPVATTAPWNAYYYGNPEGDPDTAAVAGGPFAVLAVIFGGIENAGPDLNPRTFQEALFSAPLEETGPTETKTSFGPRGPSPYTAIDNTMEIWWDPDREGNDCDRGFFWYVQAGLRRGRGDWPSSEPNVFVDDGSEQPDQDPELCS